MELKELCQAVVDGKQLQRSSTLLGDNPWYDCGHSEGVLLHLQNPNAGIRIAPTLKPVDMSVLIGSGIDCEFWNRDSAVTINDLNRTPSADRPTFSAIGGASFKYCRPRTDHWHSLLNCKADVIAALTSAGFIVIHDLEARAISLDVQSDRCYPWESEQ